MIKSIKTKFKKLKCAFYGHEYRIVFLGGTIFFEECRLCGKVK